MGIIANVRLMTRIIVDVARILIMEMLMMMIIFGIFHLCRGDAPNLKSEFLYVTFSAI